jgi:hypothetical protein
MLPIRSLWTPPADAALVADAVTELGGELGVEIQALDIDVTSCWRQRPCYVDAVARAGAERALGIEVVKTSSGHLHVVLFLIDRASSRVTELGTVRTEPGSLRTRLRAAVALLRDTLPEPPPRRLVVPPPPGEVPPLPAPPEEAPETPPPAWYQALSVDAFVSAAFTHNFNRPPAGTALRTFDTSSDAATLDVAELVVQRVASRPGDAGFRVDLVAGSAIPHVSASAGLFRDDTGKAGDFDLQQAYASYIVPIGHGLRIDAGKYVTPVGAEVIEGYDGYNDHYSHSFLFGYAIPFTHTGVRASYPFHDRFSLAAFGYNGWDVVADNNHWLSGGAQVTVLLAPELTVSATYLGGRERTGDPAWRHLGDVVASFKITPQLAVATNIDAARDGDLRWYGIAAYVRVDLTRSLVAAVRAESFADPDGARTGTGQDLWEVTVTPALRLAPGLLMRGELRYDHSSNASFASSSGDRHAQMTGAVNVVYAL